MLQVLVLPFEYVNKHIYKNLHTATVRVPLSVSKYVVIEKSLSVCVTRWRVKFEDVSPNLTVSVSNCTFI